MLPMLLTAGMVMIMVTVSGCQSGRRPFRPRDLPAIAQAKPTSNVQTADLGNLATNYPSSELIAAGDVLDVTVAAGLNEKEAVTVPIRVGDDGQARLPVIGPVQLAGLELAEAEAAIMLTAEERQVYRAPHVTVTMRRRRVNRVTVTGAVKNPGVYELPRESSDLLSAILAAGGLDKDAGVHVEIRSTGRAPIEEPPQPIASTDPDSADPNSTKVTPAGHRVQPSSMRIGPNAVRVDLVSASKEGGGKYRIPDGGVVNVEKEDPNPLQVIGLVKTPGKYDFPVGREVHVLDAIAIAGGISNILADKIYVIRPIPGQSDPAVINISLKKAKQDGVENVLLQPGDVVSIEQTPATGLIDVLNLLRFGLGASLPL